VRLLSGLLLGLAGRCAEALRPFRSSPPFGLGLFDWRRQAPPCRPQLPVCGSASGWRNELPRCPAPAGGIATFHARGTHPLLRWRQALTSLRGKKKTPPHPRGGPPPPPPPPKNCASAGASELAIRIEAALSSFALDPQPVVSLASTAVCVGCSAGLGLVDLVRFLQRAVVFPGQGITGPGNKTAEYQTLK